MRRQSLLLRDGAIEAVWSCSVLGPLLLCGQGREKCWWRMVLPIKLSGLNGSQDVPASLSWVQKEPEHPVQESHLGNGFLY